jgi:hypothetical protein
METDKVTDKIMEHEGKIAKVESDIKTLFNQQKSIEKLVDTTQSLAISVEKLASKVNDVDDRLDCIENGEKQKSFEVWRAIVPTAIVGVASFVIARLLG